VVIVFHPFSYQLLPVTLVTFSHRGFMHKAVERVNGRLDNHIKGMGVRPTHFTHPNIHANFGTKHNQA
jgi:hypothetical protein